MDIAKQTIDSNAHVAAKSSQNLQKKKLTIWVGFTSALFIALLSLFIFLSSRVVYTSVEEMTAAIDGCWFNAFSNSRKSLADRCLIIDGNNATIIYNAIDKSYDSTISYYPNQGYFMAHSSKYRVLNKSDELILIEDGKYIYYRSMQVTSPIVDEDSSAFTNEFENYVKDSNISLNYSDVQYNISNNLDEAFTLTGYAELDDYYNFGFDNDLESEYFCLSVTPDGGTYHDIWYIYCNRDIFQNLFDKAKEDKKIYVEMVCEIPSYHYERGQQNMAELQFVTYNTNS